ncbi:MAG: porin family protein [Pseudobdellovibrio sp.]|nr:porin family protein [Pseudobdellovibrio sp.]
MKNLLLALSVVLVTSAANAGGFIEPYVGYQMGKFDYGGGVEGDSKGTALGLRAGYQMVIPWFALDVQMGKGKISDVTPEDDYSYTDVGVVVGASVPFVRPFIGYVPAAKTKLKNSGSSDTVEGTGLKLGLGIKILPLVDINVEQMNYEFKEVNGIDLAEKAKHKITTIGLGITF